MQKPANLVAPQPLLKHAQQTRLRALRQPVIALHVGVPPAAFHAPWPQQQVQRTAPLRAMRHHTQAHGRRQQPAGHRQAAGLRSQAGTELGTVNGLRTGEIIGLALTRQACVARLTHLPLSGMACPADTTCVARLPA